nr:DUF29 domain-containing protein [Microcoleus sp. FACHB-68]
MQDNPSLNSYLEIALRETYENGRDLAGETACRHSRFRRRVCTVLSASRSRFYLLIRD